MVDNGIEAGHQAVERAKRAAFESSTLGPGTAGYTTSGAAYRGQEIASMNGSPSPAEPGFGAKTGLGYADDEGRKINAYKPAEDAGE